MSDVIVAFDDFIHGSGTFYTSSFFNTLLGEADAYAIEATAEGADGSPTTSLAIQLETSGDGRNWSNKNPTAEISTSVTANGKTVATASDMNVRPAVALVRLRIDVSAVVGTPALNLRVHVRPARDSGFSPARLHGCNLWLRADIGVDFAPGSTTIGSWRDGSGAGHDATQATTVRQPAYNATLINGMPTVFFDASSAGSEKIFSLAGSLSLTAGHALLVGQSTSLTPPVAARTGLWHLGGGSPSATSFPFTDGLINDDFGSSTRYACGAPVVSITTPYCYEVQATSSSWASFFNGAAQFSNPTNTVAWPGTLELGGNLAAGVFFDGHLAEVLLFDHVLESGERNALVAYLNQRYALGMV